MCNPQTVISLPHGAHLSSQPVTLVLTFFLPVDMTDILVENGHLLALTTYPGAGRSLVYYMGTGWSKADVKSAANWFDMVKKESFKIKNPLVVSILKGK